MGWLPTKEIRLKYECEIEHRKNGGRNDVERRGVGIGFAGRPHDPMQWGAFGAGEHRHALTVGDDADGPSSVWSGWGGPRSRISSLRRRPRREKKPKIGNANLATLTVTMAAPPKLTGSRETRLLGLLTYGESLEAACRAIRVSSTAVRKRAARDPAFAERLRAVREHRPARAPSDDWRAAARMLEDLYPERWALPDPFDFDGAA